MSGDFRDKMDALSRKAGQEVRNVFPISSYEKMDKFAAGNYLIIEEICFFLSSKDNRRIQGGAGAPANHCESVHEKLAHDGWTNDLIQSGN